MMVRSVAFWIFLLAGVLVAWLSWSRVEELQAQQETETAPSLLSVEVAQARLGTIREWVYGEGTARAARRDFLRFQTSGKVVFVGQDESGRDLRAGSRVRGPGEGEALGQMLVQLDRRETAEDLTMSQAQKTQAERRVESAEAAVAKAEIELDLAERNLQRMQELRKKGVISGQQHEEARAAFANATSSLRSARSELNAARSAVIEAEARLRQATVEVERTAIFAPFDGIIAYMNVRLGDLVSPAHIDTSSEQRMLETTPVVVIDPEVFEITIDLPAFDGVLVQEGLPAFVSHGAEIIASEDLGGFDPTEKFETEGRIPAFVYSVSPSISPGGRSIQVKLRTAEDAPGLHDGMFVAAWIVVQEKTEAVLAPNSAWLYANDKPYVFVADPATNMVSRREITDGIGGVPDSEILEGVAPGELLVTKGRHLMQDGEPVRIVRGEE